MKDEELTEPKILHCEYGDKESIYKRLQEEEDLFKDSEWKDIFLLAMSIGFKMGKREELKKRDPGGLIRTDTLNDLEKALIKAIAIASTKSIDILLDKREPYRIAEEYANAGIKILERKILSEPMGTYHKELAATLIDYIKEDEKNTGKNE